MAHRTPNNQSQHPQMQQQQYRPRRASSPERHQQGYGVQNYVPGPGPRTPGNYNRSPSEVHPGSSVSQIPPYGQQQAFHNGYYGSPVPSNQMPPVPPPQQPQQYGDPYLLRQQQAPRPQAASSATPGFVRKRTVKQIPLTPQGNLVIDVPVADRVSKMGKYGTGDEFTHMRYTAVTCPADEFASKGYSLRQQELGRSTEIFIVVTMYNEDDFLFCKSMQALMKNVAYLCSRSRSSTWGQDGWKKIIICIVSDGRAKVNPRVLDVLGIMGVFQNGIMKDHVNEKTVTAHLFEYTTQVCVTPDLKVHGHEKGYVPVQILFCLKEKNAKKINSHRWFFNAFGPLLRPEVCILIDCGTKPTPSSIYHLWKAFDRNPAIGGSCGEIYAEIGDGCTNLLNPLVAAQNFEYKMSNILDKPLESVFGYISVLPGAFSAYRYKALLGKPLEQYFKGEALHGSEDIFAANMYLAEDRILCFEIVTKVREAWLLKYVKSAKAETDVPDSTPEFISQRRRWLNGSFFASVHALTHWFYIFRSGHNGARKLLLCVEFAYNLVNLFFAWFNIGFFYLTFFFLVGGIAKDDPIGSTVSLNDPFFFNGVRYGKTIFPVSQGFYIISVVIVFICSLGNRPQGSKWLYNMSIFFFALIMLLMLFVGSFSIYNTMQQINLSSTTFGQALQNNTTFRDIIISTASTLGLYILSSCLYLDPWHMITSFAQYMLFLPSFTNILNVYAFCNLHDVSWGTKGDNAAASLGGVVAKKVDGKETVEVDLITDLRDINTNYEKFIRNLAEPRPAENKKRDAKTKMEDYFKNFRTRVVLSWLFSNLLVIVALSNTAVLDAIQKPLLLNPNNAASKTDGNPFLQFIFWSVFGLSLIRFAGSTTYLVLRALRG